MSRRCGGAGRQPDRLGAPARTGIARCGTPAREIPDFSQFAAEPLPCRKDELEQRNPQGDRRRLRRDRAARCVQRSPTRSAPQHPRKHDSRCPQARGHARTAHRTALVHPEKRSVGVARRSAGRTQTRPVTTPCAGPVPPQRDSDPKLPPGGSGEAFLFRSAPATVGPGGGVPVEAVTGGVRPTAAQWRASASRRRHHRAPVGPSWRPVHHTGHYQT